MLKYDFPVGSFSTCWKRFQRLVRVNLDTSCVPLCLLCLFFSCVLARKTRTTLKSALEESMDYLEDVPLVMLGDTS